MEDGGSLTNPMTSVAFEYGICRCADGSVAYLAPEGLEEFEDGDTLAMTVEPVEADYDDTLPEGDEEVARDRPVPTYQLQNQMLLHVTSVTRVETGHAAKAARRAYHGVTEFSLVNPQEMDVIMIRLAYRDRHPGVYGDPRYGTEASVMEELLRLPTDTGYSTPFQGSVADMLRKTTNNQIYPTRARARVVTVQMNTLAPSDMSCPYTAMADAADAAVQQQFGFNPSNYTYREYFLPIDRDIGCRWGGLAMMGCGRYGHIPAPGSCRAWYRQSGAFTRAHELGHNLGLAHAGGEQGGSFVEYGDPQAIMGASFVMSSFIAGARSQLGTLPDSQVITWTPGMRHREIYSISHDLHTTGTARAALKFACPNCVPRVEARSGNIGGEIWVQYRGNEGYSSLALSQQDYQNRVYVHLMRRVNSRYGGSGKRALGEPGAGPGLHHPQLGHLRLRLQHQHADRCCRHWRRSRRRPQRPRRVRRGAAALAAEPARPTLAAAEPARVAAAAAAVAAATRPAAASFTGMRTCQGPRAAIPTSPAAATNKATCAPTSPASRLAARSSCKSASSSRCRALWPASPPAASAPRCPEISVLARCTTSTARLRACAAWASTSSACRRATRTSSWTSTTPAASPPRSSGSSCNPTTTTCDSSSRGYLRPCWNRANQTVLYGPQYFVRANTPPQPPPSPPDPPFSPPPPLTAPSPPPSPEREDCQSWCDVGQMMDRCTTYPTMCGGCSFAPSRRRLRPRRRRSRRHGRYRPTARAGVSIASSPAAATRRQCAADAPRALLHRRPPKSTSRRRARRRRRRRQWPRRRRPRGPLRRRVRANAGATWGDSRPAATGEDRAGAAPDAVVAARPRRRRRRRHRRPPTDQLLHRRRRHHRRRRRRRHRRRRRRRRRRPTTDHLLHRRRLRSRRVRAVAGAASPRTQAGAAGASAAAARVARAPPPRSTSRRRALLGRSTAHPKSSENSRAKKRPPLSVREE